MRRAIKLPTVSIWPLALLFLPLIIFLRNPSGFSYPSPGAEYSDISISHYPNMLFLKRTLSETGKVPLWSPGILSGYPFAANPLSGLWYPFGWIALVTPLPLGLNLLAAFHLLWGGAGIFFLLKKEGLRDNSAVFGALAFELMPKLFAHYGAGHLTLVYAVSWTPWLLWAARKARQAAGPWQAAPAVILALICLADPRWVAYAGILWVLYSATDNPIWTRVQKYPAGVTPLARLYPFLKASLKFLATILPQAGISVLLAAPLLSPLLEYAGLSTRAQMSAAEVLHYSLPPQRLLGLFFPDYGGYHEFMVYTGGMITVLVVFGLAKKRKAPQERFWLWISLLSMGYALGSRLPLMSYLAGLPGLSLLRVPSRSLFLLGLAFAVMSAYSLETLQAHDDVDARGRSKMALVGLNALVISLTLGVGFFSGEIPTGFLWGTVLVTIANLWVWSRLANVIPMKIWIAGTILIAVVDLFVMDTSLVAFRDRKEVMQEQEEVATFLADQEGNFRVYSPSYSLPQQVAMRYRLELADGVDPLQAQSYVDFMEAATGVPVRGYSVTLPPFETGDPAHDNANYSPAPALLGLLNVRYLASAYNLEIEGLVMKEQFGETWIYENTAAHPRAWVQTGLESPTSDYLPAEITAWSPNQISVSASGPGVLVLSEIMYPGWEVLVDGEEQQILPQFGLLRGVPLHEGSHEVVFRFRSPSIYLGISLFLLGIIASMLYTRRRSVRATP